MFLFTVFHGVVLNGTNKTEFVLTLINKNSNIHDILRLYTSIEFENIIIYEKMHCH